jgi:hypothetical protein
MEIRWRNWRQVEFVEFVEFVELIKTETLRDTIEIPRDTLGKLGIGGCKNDAEG